MKIRNLLSGMILFCSPLNSAFAWDLADMLPDRSRIYCRIVAVLDGDTADCVRENRSYRIRLSNIDAPEKSQAYGRASKKRLSALIYGNDVVVELEGQDRYGRYLGVIYLDGENINARQVEEGLAWAYRPHTSPEYLLKEEYARENRLGLWQDPLPENPAEYRKRHRK